MKTRTWFWVLAASFAAQQTFAFYWRDPQSLAASAVADSPRIARLQSELIAAVDRGSYTASQPNPMVMTGVQDKQIDLTDDEMMTMYMVGASQRFVRPSKRDVKREAGALAVKAIEQQIVSAQAEIERFYQEKGRYPKPTEAGQLSWESLGKPQRGRFVLDGFARPVEYQVAGAWKVASYRVRSFGYDGRPGGGDDLCVSGATKLGRLGAKFKVDRNEGGGWSIRAKLAGVAEMRCEAEE